VLSEGCFNRVGQRLEKGLKKFNISMTRVHFNGQCSREEIKHLFSQITENVSDKTNAFVMCVGGGKTVDAG